MLKFRAITENQKFIQSEDLNCDRGKVDKNHSSKIVFRKFTRVINSSTTALFPTERNESSERSAVVDRERERER